MHCSDDIDLAEIPPTEAGGGMITREVAGILAAAEGATATMSREDITRMTDTMMDGTAMALGTIEGAHTTEAGNSSSSSSSPEDDQIGATQADGVTRCSLDTAMLCSIPAVYMPYSMCMSLCLCNVLEGTTPFFV